MHRIVLTLCVALWGVGGLGADQAAVFFDDSAVREIRLYFSDANWYNTLYQAHNSNPEDPYFPARFRYGDTVMESIGVRFKGNASFRRNGVKKSFKLDFNRYNPDATFLGLKKLNLNTGDLQPDLMREKLFLDFAGKFVAARRAVHVRLYVNDAYYGLYIAVEQPDKTMMQSRFGDDEDGNLFEALEFRGDLTYQGTDPAAYASRYELKTNEAANDYSDLIKFIDVLNNTAADLPAKLEPICDVENMLYGIAIDILFTNLDSYVGGGGEYYLYHRSDSGRFVYIQYDSNEVFGTTGDGTPSIANPFAMDPFWLPGSATTTGPGGRPGGGGPGAPGGTARPLMEKLWAVDAYKRMYLRQLARMLREGFDPDSMGARIQQLANLIRTDVYADPNKPYTNAQFETALTSQVAAGQLPLYGLLQFVRERYNYLRPALHAYAQPSDVRLNEVMTSGSNPWVELHNLGPGPVSLSGFYLTDDAANPTKLTLPAQTLADGEFLVVSLGASFRPSEAGGTLYLYSTGSGTQTPIDRVTYPRLTTGQSWIRIGNSGSQWLLTTEPTAGAANPATGISQAVGTGVLRINELMADNESAVEDPDERGAYEDWIEIYNPGSATVDMSAMYLTDNLANPTKWQAPQGLTIPPRGYLVFWADNDVRQGARHTNFNLDADGEEIALFQPDGKTLIDAVTFRAQQPNVSLGRASDGGGEWAIFQPATPGAANAQPMANWIVNAASFQIGPLAAGAVASAFGQNLAASTAAAASTPLPATLGGTTVTVTDSANATHSALLFFVSSGQVNFQVPASAAPGRAKITMRRQDGTALSGDILIQSIAPGVFSANANGQGVGLIAALRVNTAGVQTPLSVYSYDASVQRSVPVPFGLGADSDKVYLVLYGTGIRGVEKLADVRVQVGNQDVAVLYAGAQNDFVGLDQVNVGPLPRALAGKGEVEVELRVAGRRANRVTVKIQ
jgi:uncharacterized protein (TIGR03437 family)